VLAQLLRHHERGRTLPELRAFFARSLGGAALADQLEALLVWLSAPNRCLAYSDEQGRKHASVLGQRAAQSLLPLDMAAGAGQLVRDLLTADAEDHFLGQWQPLDHLILLELLHPHRLPGRRFSEKLVEQVDGWMAGPPAHGSLIYQEWIRPAAGPCRADEVLGSLGWSMQPNRREGDSARELAYLAVLRALILVGRACGQEAGDLERRWGLSGLEGSEERWRDDLLWLLSGWARLLDIRCFYYHLREVCAADRERVLRIGRLLRQLRGQVFVLQEQLRRCAPLVTLPGQSYNVGVPGQEGTHAR
jgi:hypothetical protein